MENVLEIMRIVHDKIINVSLISSFFFNLACVVEPNLRDYERNLKIAENKNSKATEKLVVLYAVLGELGSLIFILFSLFSIYFIFSLISALLLVKIHKCVEEKNESEVAFYSLATSLTMGVMLYFKFIFMNQ